MNTSIIDVEKFQANVVRLAEYFKTNTPEMCTQEYFDSKTAHYFCDGVYVRTYEMFAGEAVIGKIHKYSNISSVVKGSAIVVSTYDPPRLIKAGDIFVTAPLNQNIIVALEDFKLSTTHRTDLIDPVEIVKQFTLPDNSEQIKLLINSLQQLGEQL